MKAIIYTLGGKFEAQLENGVTLTSIEGENDVDFSNRVANSIEEDYMDTADVTIADPKKIKRKGTTALTKDLETATGMHAAIIEQILEKRAATAAKAAAASAPAEPTDETGTEDVAEAEKPAAKKAKKTTAKKPAAKKAPKPKKEPKPKPVPFTDEQLASQLEEAKENIAKECSFVPFRSNKVVKGTVKTAFIDKRVRKVYYRITSNTEDKKLYHLLAANPTFATK